MCIISYTYIRTHMKKPVYIQQSMENAVQQQQQWHGSSCCWFSVWFSSYQQEQTRSISITNQRLTRDSKRTLSLSLSNLILQLLRVHIMYVVFLYKTLFPCCVLYALYPLLPSFLPFPFTNFLRLSSLLLQEHMVARKLFFIVAFTTMLIQQHTVQYIC